MKISSYFSGTLSLFLCLWSFSGYSQTAPVIGLHENTPDVAAFVNARIVKAPGSVIEKGTLVIRNGRVESVGENVTVPPDAAVIDSKNKTIYPAFIDIYSHYGMPDDNLGSTGAPVHWNGLTRPEGKAVEMFKPDAAAASAMRKNGFAAVMTFPKKGIFRGSGAFVLLGDGKSNDCVIDSDFGQSLSLTWNSEPYPSDNYPVCCMGTIALIRQTFCDVRWYEEAIGCYEKSPVGQKRPETNLSLEALEKAAKKETPCIFESTEYLDTYRAGNMGREFGIDIWARGSGDEYKRLDAVKNSSVKMIIPLNFPDPPDVSTDMVTLQELRRWDFAPENPARLAGENIPFTITQDNIEKPEFFLRNLRKAVKRGLSRDAALSALTVTPAGWVKKSNLLGTLEPGKYANLIITDGDVFEDKTKILETWVDGSKYVVNVLPDIDIRGTWEAVIAPDKGTGTLIFKISGESDKPVVEIAKGETKIKALMTAVEKKSVSLAFKTDSLGTPGTARFRGIAGENLITGNGTWPDGSEISWNAVLKEKFTSKPDTLSEKDAVKSEFPVVFPESPFGRENSPAQPDYIYIKNAVIWTCGPLGKIDGGEILIEKGVIKEVGKNIKPPAGALVIDARGKQVTPGIIDAHNHVAFKDGVNEYSQSVVPDVTMSDIIDSEDINIYYLLAGGTTTVNTLHGSANPIGGRNTVLKMRWGGLPGDMICDYAPPNIKFALGENVKRAGYSGNKRYPGSRLGVDEIIRDAFMSAKDYRAVWQEYEKKKGKNKYIVPPRKDIRMEVLLDILDGKTAVQCHAYREDEIIALMRTAEEAGFKVKLFIHLNEGYKVATELKKHGAMATVFSDWWAYKMEVYDSTPYNGALLNSQGVLVSFNSDSNELSRRLNFEAAKAVKYGDVPEEEALKFVTLNPAIQLGIDKRTGSLEKGKDADFVIWSGSPLSGYSKCEQTWIDGKKYFDINENVAFMERTNNQKNILIQKVLNSGKEK